MTTIRLAHLEDSEALAQLAESTFRETFTTADNLADMDLHCARNFGGSIQRQQILDPNYVTILAEAESLDVESLLVGFAQVRLHSPKECVAADRTSELHRLYVSKAWQGRGVAHKVMTQVLAAAASAGADQIWLGVWEHNPRAIAFYGKYGFRVVGEHLFQFGKDPQRDLVMAATVKLLPVT